MKHYLGIVMVSVGVFLGLYVGVWLCFVGGIVAIIEQVRAENLSAIIVAWGIARVFLAGFFGFLSGMFLIVPGVAIMSES